MLNYSLVGCSILTMDEDNNYYQDGVIVIEDGVITNIGERKAVKIKGEAISMAGKLLMPGLINCHTHLPSPLYRGIGSDLSLMDWLEKSMWPAQAHMTAEDSYWGSYLSCIEFIQNGITTFVDQYYYADANARAVQDAGLRGVIGATVFEHGSIESDNTLLTACEFIEKYKSIEHETMIYPCFGPHAPYTEGPDTYKKVTELAKKYGVPIHTHISENQDEVNIMLEKYHMTSVELLESVGVFDVPVISAHNVYLSENDIEIFKKHNVKVVYNPVSNMKLACGFARLKPLVEAGLCIALGTDGAESNNSMDLFRDLRTGLLLQKTLELDATMFNAEFGIRMITTKGAEAVNLSGRIGKLSIGMEADIIALDDKFASMTPLFNQNIDHIYATLAYAVDGRCVSDTIVRGKWLMQNREIVAFDAVHVRKKAQRSAERIMREAKLVI